MGIDQTNVVDAIGVDKENGVLVLTIADHLPWSDTSEHLLLLQEKLNTYLAFLEGGEIYQVYPDAKGRNVVIELLFKYPPNEHSLEFLAKAGFAIQQAGFELIHRQVDDCRRDH